MYKSSFHILRVSLAITFLWIGILIIKDPLSWATYLQPWVTDWLPTNLRALMLSTAVLDLLIGLLFLTDYAVWLAAGLGALHLITVLIVSGLTEITIRDIGLLGGTLSLLITTLLHKLPNPQKIKLDQENKNL